MVLHLNNLEYPTPKDALLQVWLKLVQWFLRRRFFNFCQCIFFLLYRKLSPLEKGQGPSFQQTWVTFIQGGFVSCLVEIGPVVLEKKIFKYCQCIFAIS